MRLYSAKELAEATGVSLKSITRYVQSGLIKPVYSSPWRVFDDKAVQAVARYKVRGTEGELISQSQLAREVGMSRWGLIQLLKTYDINPVKRVSPIEIYYPRSLIAKINKLRAKRSGSVTHGSANESENEDA